MHTVQDSKYSQMQRLLKKNNLELAFEDHLQGNAIINYKSVETTDRIKYLGGRLPHLENALSLIFCLRVGKLELLP